MSVTANNNLIISVKSTEIEIALLEDMQLVELHKEERNVKFSVGDIYLGRVKRLAPSLNATFVDVGSERDAFLHYLDLGHQFASLNKFVKQTIQTTSPVPLQKFTCEEDIDKYGKIGDVLKPGQQVLVQIAKEPIRNKGPRIASEISIAGRNLVLVPFSNKVSVSQKITSPEERKRLRTLMQSITPANFGVIIRTVAQKQTIEVLDRELKDLLQKWDKVFEKLKATRSPALVFNELDRTIAILRDLLNASFSGIYIDNKKLFQDVKKYIANIAPEKEEIIKYYSGKKPIFQHFNVTRQIKSLFGKTVPLRGGAYLIIEHTEALHAIDVNSGNRTKKWKDQETNAIEVNLMAATEIARQLRLRDIGGLIVIDFIDMQQEENKNQLVKHMRQLMGKNRTRHTILDLSRFGLMEITRQRVRPETLISIGETCPVCKGTGELTPSISLIDTIADKIRYIVEQINPSSLTIVAHPFVVAFIKQGIISLRWKWTFELGCFIKVKEDIAFSYFQYKIFDKTNEEIK